MSFALVDSVVEALRHVIDPELGVNVVDLGLIYEIRVDGGRLNIVMTMTTPGCPVQNYITAGVRNAACLVPGVTDVDVTVVWDPRWSPERMSAAAKRYFGLPAGERAGRPS